MAAAAALGGRQAGADLVQQALLLGAATVWLVRRRAA